MAITFIFCAQLKCQATMYERASLTTQYSSKPPRNIILNPLRKREYVIISVQPLWYSCWIEQRTHSLQRMRVCMYVCDLNLLIKRVRLCNHKQYETKRTHTSFWMTVYQANESRWLLQKETKTSVGGERYRKTLAIKVKPVIPVHWLSRICVLHFWDKSIHYDLGVLFVSIIEHECTHIHLYVYILCRYMFAWRCQERD